jgi:hypothetical protein
MGCDIRTAEWLNAKQVDEVYAIKRSSLDRRVKEGKIVALDDKKYGARKGTKRYLQDSIKQYINSLGNGVDKETNQKYRYNTEKKYPYPIFFINTPNIYIPINLN